MRTTRMLTIRTDRAPAFYDITAEVAETVLRADVLDGFVVVFSRHTTAALCINEYEPLLIRDMEDLLMRVAPPDMPYRHNDFSIRTVNMTRDERPNGHAHCQRLFLPSSEMVPIGDGRLLLGTWQRLFLVELDRPRRREVVVKIVHG